MSNAPEWKDADTEAEPERPKRDDAGDVKRMLERIDQLRVMLTTMRREAEELGQRGLPIVNATVRLGRAADSLQEARDYWEYDVVRGNGRITKDMKAKAANYDLS